MLLSNGDSGARLALSRRISSLGEKQMQRLAGSSVGICYG
jgi:hypothetical protein